MTIDRCIVNMFGCTILAILCSGGALHASCADTLQGEARVSSILDARTLRLDDGREVRLAGVEIPEEIAARTVVTVSSLMNGREITLHGVDDRPDRYGRQPAFVFAKNSPTPVQSELLASGDALVSGTVPDKACSVALFAAEAAARVARRGIWAGSAALKNAERTDDILTRTGRFAVVEGTVSSARLAGGTFYLNFGRRWTRDFAVTISRRMMPSFEAAGIDFKSLKDKTVRVRGWIEKRGGPRIEATHPGQIEFISAAGLTLKNDLAAKNSVPKDKDE